MRDTPSVPQSAESQLAGRFYRLWQRNQILAAGGSWMLAECGTDRPLPIVLTDKGRAAVAQLGIDLVDGSDAAGASL